MIVLYKNRGNNVVMTLNEKATQTQHDWLIEIVNDTSGEKKYFTPTDIAPGPITNGATKRYNEFELFGSGLTGSYTYNAYEMPVMSPRSTDPALAYSLCETGKVLLIEETESDAIEFDVDDTKNNAVFDA